MTTFLEQVNSLEKQRKENYRNYVAILEESVDLFIAGYNEFNNLLTSGEKTIEEILLNPESVEKLSRLNHQRILIRRELPSHRHVSALNSEDRERLQSLASETIANFTKFSFAPATGARVSWEKLSFESNIAPDGLVLPYLSFNALVSSIEEKNALLEIISQWYAIIVQVLENTGNSEYKKHVYFQLVSYQGYINLNPLIMFDEEKGKWVPKQLDGVMKENSFSLEDLIEVFEYKH